MTTPNISEAARRAAEAVKSKFSFSLEIPDAIPTQYPPDYREVGIEEVAAVIQSALDSAHHAPKEGEAVKPFAVFDKFTNREMLVVYWDDFHSLQLRLSEKTREVEALRQERDDIQDAKKEYHDRIERLADALSVPFPRSFNDVIGTASTLRAQLQKANELLGEAHSILGNSGWSIEPNCPWHDRIARHLNQQSK